MDRATKADIVLGMLGAEGDYTHSSGVCCQCGETREMRPWAGAAVDACGRQRGICWRCVRTKEGERRVLLDGFVKDITNAIRAGRL